MFSKSRGFDPFSLVIGILAVALSFFIMAHPGASFMSIVYVIAIMSIIEGVLKLAELSGVSGWAIFSGILNIIIGILIFFVPSLGAVYIWITLALWFIIDSLYELYFSRLLEKTNKGYFWILVILGVLGVILGVMLLFNPIFAQSLAVYLVAFYFMVFGISSIIRSF